MKTTEMILIVVYLASACLVPMILPIWVGSKSFRNLPLAKERFSIRLPFYSIELSGLTLSRLCAYCICYAALDSLPFFPSWAALGFTMVLVSWTSDWLRIRRERFDAPLIKTPLNLIPVEAELLKAQAYIHQLMSEISKTIEDLKCKEDLRVKLEEAIAKKEQEHEEWQKLSDAQKDYFVGKVFEHSPKPGYTRDMVLVIVGFILNILASAIWALLGNPGKAELVEYIRKYILLGG